MHIHLELLHILDKLSVCCYLFLIWLILLPSVLYFYVNLTQTIAIGEERTSTEKMTSLDQWGKPICILIADWNGKACPIVGSGIHGLAVMGFMRKQAEQAMG